MKREYVDKFITDHYSSIEAKFRALDGTLRSNGESTLDVLNDTMLNLYNDDREYRDYKAYEVAILRKFTPKETRPQIEDIDEIDEANADDVTDDN